jgi:two-component system response regulator YesN
MIRVAILDDEEIVRARLINMINSTKLDVKIVAIFENGFDAYEELLQTPVDILITDIRVPYIDGIELSKKIKEEINPFMKIIIITGFDEFDYAKQAISIEVSGFLSKPINKEEFSQVLEKTINKINNESKINSYLDELSNLKKTFKDRIVENDVYQLFDDDSVKDNILKKLKIEGIDLYDKSIILGVVNSLSMSLENSDLIYLTLLKKLSELDKLQFYLHKRSSSFVFILYSQTQVNQQYVESMLINIIAQIKKYIQIDLYCGLSLVFTANDSFRKMYVQTRSTLDFRKGSGDVFLVSKLENNTYFIDDKWHKKLNYALKFESIKEIYRLFDDIKVELDGLTPIPYQVFIGDTINTIVKTLKDSSLIVSYTEIFDFENYKNSLVAIKSFKELSKRIRDLNQSTVDNSAFLNVKKIISYCQANYANSELSLETLSSSIFLSTSYISHLLKEAGYPTFVKLLTNIRLEKAKELLEVSGARISDVSEKVGYIDPYYFSHCFKKYYKQSPKTYKNEK